MQLLKHFSAINTHLLRNLSSIASKVTPIDILYTCFEALGITKLLPY